MNAEYANILKYAMRMEKEGAEFFLTQSKRFQDATTKRLFEKLAVIEESHYDYLQQQLNHYTEGNLTTEDIPQETMDQTEAAIFSSRAESEHLNTTLVESDTPDITVLRMAYLIEKDFAEFYENARDYVEDESLKALFTQLSDWEKGHESLFKREYQRLMKEYMTLPWGG